MLEKLGQRFARFGVEETRQNKMEIKTKTKQNKTWKNKISNLFLFFFRCLILTEVVVVVVVATDRGRSWGRFAKWLIAFNCLFNMFFPLCLLCSAHYAVHGGRGKLRETEKNI